jgi:iron complex transport system substrate-binding protein
VDTSIVIGPFAQRARACIAAFASALACLLPCHATCANLRVVDDAGVTVTLAAPAERIVSLAPHATELLFAVGAGDRIVGVMSDSDFPPAAKRIPIVGNVNALDLEYILSLRPDLIVTWPYTTPAQVGLLRAQGIAVFTTDPRTIEGIALDLERLGSLVGRSDVANETARRLRARLAALAERAAGKRLVRIFYQVSGVPLYTVGGQHLISQALTLCGAQNVFDSLALPAPEVGVEAVLAARPEAIVAGTAGAAAPAWLEEWRRWPELPAVRADKLFVVDANLLHRSGPRFVEGVEQLCDVIERARAQ